MVSLCLFHIEGAGLRSVSFTLPTRRAPLAAAEERSGAALSEASEEDGSGIGRVGDRHWAGKVPPIP